MYFTSITLLSLALLHKTHASKPSFDGLDDKPVWRSLPEHLQQPVKHRSLPASFTGFRDLDEEEDPVQFLSLRHEATDAPTPAPVPYISASQNNFAGKGNRGIWDKTCSEAAMFELDKPIGTANILAALTLINFGNSKPVSWLPMGDREMASSSTTDNPSATTEESLSAQESEESSSVVSNHNTDDVTVFDLGGNSHNVQINFFDTVLATINAVSLHTGIKENQLGLVFTLKEGDDQQVTLEFGDETTMKKPLLEALQEAFDKADLSVDMLNKEIYIVQSLPEDLRWLLPSGRFLGAYFKTKELNNIKPSYRSRLENIGVTVDVLDLASSINDKVSEVTNGLINEIITQPQVDDAPCVLLSADYLKIEWNPKFEQKNSLHTDFMTFKREVVHPNKWMQKLGGKARFLQNNKFKAVLLETKSIGVKGMVLLPNQEGEVALREAVNSLQDLESLEQFTLQPVDITMPEFDAKLDMTNIADMVSTKLGMNLAGDDIWIDQGSITGFEIINHAAVMKWDHAGAEAAAATAGAPKYRSATFMVEQRIDFTVNRPFAAFLVHQPVGDDETGNLDFSQILFSILVTKF
eukprot:g1466.t1